MMAGKITPKEVIKEVDVFAKKMGYRREKLGAYVRGRDGALCVSLRNPEWGEALAVSVFLKGLSLEFDEFPLTYSYFFVVKEGA